MNRRQSSTPPSLSFSTLSFLSDFGFRDEFVGVTKSVIYEIAPTARIVDITHGIPPHNVRAGALTLARAGGYLCPGVVLAVVDPGVGSTRRAIAVEVGGGSSVLLGPDNGLLAPVVAIVGGPNRVVELNNTQYHLPIATKTLGTTFAARDIFAPSAAHIMKGVPLTELGTEIDPNSLVPHIIPASRSIGEGHIKADVLWIDQFGNVQLNLEAKDLDALKNAATKQSSGASLTEAPASLGASGSEVKPLVQLSCKELVRTLTIATNYSEINPGDLALTLDSYGLIAIVAPKSSASLELGLAEGDEVELKTITSIPLG